jgi:hypothetical protein
MGLLARVQELTAGREKTTIGEQDVADGIEFLESLKSRVKRGNFNGERLPQEASGQTVETVLQKLAKSDPPKV